MVTSRQYSDTDVELAAEWLYSYWHDSVPFADQAQDVRGEYLGAARSALEALTAASWHPPGQCLYGIAEAAIAYVDAPEGSDECVARWYELKGAVEHLRAVDSRLVPEEVATGEPAGQASCCDIHGRDCEPPSELCCERCTEARHPFHPPGVACTWASDADVAFGQAVQRLAGNTGGES